MINDGKEKTTAGKQHRNEPKYSGDSLLFCKRRTERAESIISNLNNYHLKIQHSYHNCVLGKRYLNLHLHEKVCVLSKCLCYLVRYLKTETLALSFVYCDLFHIFLH